jgi:hypothetical protein
MRCFSALLVGILTGTLASAVLAGDQEYIYVDLGWTDSSSDSVDCEYLQDQLRTIMYDDLAIVPHDLESHLLFRLNNVRESGSTKTAQIAGWINAQYDSSEDDVIPSAYAWTIKLNGDDVQVSFNDLPGNDDAYSWATAVSDNGIVAGMAGNPDPDNGSITWHKAAVWEQHGSGYQRPKIDPHENLSAIKTSSGSCEDQALFESCAFGVIDVEGDWWTSYAITGGCDAGCTKCMEDTRLARSSAESRAMRAYTMSPVLGTDIIDAGLWGQNGQYVSHQLALSFLGDESINVDDQTILTAIGHGRRLMGWEADAIVDGATDCSSMSPAGNCGSPIALPTTFAFPDSFQEHLYFQENLDEDTIPDGHAFNKYNTGILRDSYGNEVVGTTKDNINCETCEANTGDGCPFSTTEPACFECYERAVHWSNLEVSPHYQTPSYLPLLDDTIERNYQGHGIGSHDERLQIVGHADAAALLWQQDERRQWDVPLDLNEHLDAGHIHLNGIDPRINIHELHLASAHDVNDSGWIVGIANARYCKSTGDDPGDGTDCTCDVDAPNGMTAEHPRPFLLIPAPCNYGNPCPGDFNGDGEVNGADVGLMLAAWSKFEIDLNCDGFTDGADFGLLLASWGPCPSSP